MSPVLQRAKETLLTEIEGLQGLITQLDRSFEDAVEFLFGCRGKIIVTGMGKSGLIGQKIASTLTSTGSPALFLHPAESSHGDLGLITETDAVIALSFSGETAEVVQIIGHIQALGVPLIAMTGNAGSTLARSASVHLSVAVPREACPLGLAPTTSTTATLALGDALAMCLLEKRNFREEDFALFHPGGSLGKKLTITVGDLMAHGDHLPLVSTDASIRDAVQVLSDKMLGIVIVVDDKNSVQGVFTVGDLMRLVDRSEGFMHRSISEVMSAHPKTIHADVLAAKALYIMETHSITCLVVTDDHQPTGVIQIYDILRAGVY